MKIAFLLDSGSSYKITNEPDCYLVPMIIEITDKSENKIFRDKVDIDEKQLKQYLIEKKKLITSQPSIGQILEISEQLLNQYDKIVAIPFTKHLSSTYQTFISIQNEIGKDKFLVANSNFMSITGDWFVNDLKEFLSKNNDINQEQLDKLCEQNREKQCGALIISDPDYLIAGGRLKGFKGLIVKTLKLKLIIKYKGGLEFADKAHEFCDAIDKSLEIINKDCNYVKNGIKRCVIFNGIDDEILAEKYINYIKEKIGNNYDIATLPGCVQCHTGPNNFSIIIETK